MKYSHYLFISLVTISSFVAGASAQYYRQQRFTDIPPGYWAEYAINYVNERGIMTGKTPFIFDPTGIVNRAELAVVLQRMYEVTVNSNYKNSYTPPYNYNTNYSTNQNYNNNNNNAFGSNLDSQRRKDVREIADALQKYATSNANVFPSQIPKNEYKEICYSSSGLSCKDRIDLNVIQYSYLTTIPRDPKLVLDQQTSTSQKDARTGYLVQIDQSGRLHVLSQLATETIEEVRNP